MLSVAAAARLSMVMPARRGWRIDRRVAASHGARMVRTPRTKRAATRRPRRPASPPPAPPPTPPTRVEQKLATRERIRQAAWELFTTVGYDDTTTRQVANRAGVAAGTIFVHAADKPDLLFLVMHDRLSQAVEAQMATLPSPAHGLLPRLLHVFSGLFRMYGEHPALSAAFVRVLPGASTARPNGQQVDALTFGFIHRLSMLVREAQERGEVARDLEPPMVAQQIFALYFFSLLSWIGGYQSIDLALDPGLRSQLQLLHRGLQPR